MNDGAERILRSVVIVGEDSAWVARQADSLRNSQGPLARAVGEVVPVEGLADAPDLIRRLCPDLVLAQAISPRKIIRFIQKVQSLSPDTPVVVVSETPSVDEAVRFIRAGAFDNIASSLDEKTIARLIDGMKVAKASRTQRHQRLFCEECPPGVEIVGHSPGLVKCLETIRLVSESRCNPVLILGETGVGKELIARAVHWWRYGDFERFIAVNCAALTATLLESELFGHVKGAFTGADREKTGLFEQANDGSILLDEISEMAPELQAKLLRVLQERTFRKVGGGKDIHCNATIIASSNKNLLADVQTGKFRRDLYYRLAVFPVTVPALRQEDRRSDIGLLAEYFLESSVAARSGTLCLGKEAEQRLARHAWPGNVRELRNVIERASILEKSDQITVSSLVFDGQTTPAEAPTGQKPRKDFSLVAAEREFIVRALRETGWQRTRAAALLGITRATLHAKLKRYDIQTPDGQKKPMPSCTDSEELVAHNCPNA